MVLSLRTTLDPVEHRDEARRLVTERNVAGASGDDAIDRITLLADYAERPRQGDWSLRSSLVRFAQAEPTRAGALLEVVRRCDAALHPLAKELATSGRNADVDADVDTEAAVGLLTVALELDELADRMAEWAVDASATAPVSEVDRICSTIPPRLDDLGIARESGGPPRRRGG